MKKELFAIFLILFFISSNSFADLREGLFIRGDIGIGALTESETDPGGEIGFGLGYGFTEQVSMFSSLNIVFPESGTSSMVLALFGLGGLYYPAQVDGLFLGFQIGAYELGISPASENSDSYSFDGAAMGLKAGYEFQLAGSLAGGFDLSYLILDKASKSFDGGGGLTTTIEFEDNLILALFYLKYGF